MAVVEMYTPKEEKVFMIRDSAWPRDTEPGIDEIASEFFGRKYRGQQTGDMMANDTYHVYYCSDETSNWWRDMAEEPEFLKKLEAWLALDVSDYDYDFQVYRQAPTPEYVIPYLVSKGALAQGTYVVQVSW